MKKILNSKVLVAATAITLFASSGLAYQLLKPERTWKKPPLYIVDDRGASSITDGDGGLSATVNAITSSQAWNGAGAGDVVNATAGDVSGWRLGDGVPMLNFRDPENVCTGGCLAATFIGFYQRHGRNAVIFDADIVTNASYNWTSELEPDGCFQEFYIEGVHVHEIGHGLGLAHSDVSGATMFPSVAACDNGPATISSDDIAGIMKLYGSDDGDGGGGSCSLLPKGGSCTANGQCCSGKCRGPSGGKSCK